VRRSLYLWILSLVALSIFLWPFWTLGFSFDQGLIQILVIPAIVLCAGAALLLLDGELLGPKQVALLGLLSALGAAVRVATGGTGGFELVFAIVILGAAAYGSRFGFLLGAMTILVSSLFFGGIGPWTPFQVFAVGWVGAGAGILSRSRKFVVPVLAGYAVVASYLFGLVMNAWFWPYATGFDSSISYSVSLTGLENLNNFLTYSLLSSTLTWDTVRAVSVALFILVFGKAMIRTFQRAKI
jgi:hypothetical protein